MPFWGRYSAAVPRHEAGGPEPHLWVELIHWAAPPACAYLPTPIRERGAWQWPGTKCPGKAIHDDPPRRTGLGNCPKAASHTGMCRVGPPRGLAPFIWRRSTDYLQHPQLRGWTPADRSTSGGRIAGRSVLFPHAMGALRPDPRPKPGDSPGTAAVTAKRATGLRRGGNSGLRTPKQARS